MRPKTTDTARHEQLIADLEAHARADRRVRAAWLEGSFASGLADPSSDVDLHLAVSDTDFEAFTANAREWVAAVRQPVGYLPVSFGRRRMFGFSLDDWMRLDLFVEPTSQLGDHPRPVSPRVLFDHHQHAGEFRVDAQASTDPAARIAEIIKTLLFGFTFPARLSGREEWGSLHLNALLVIYQFIAPAMIAQRHPEQAFRPQLHNERFLDPDQRKRIDTLVEELARAFSSIPPQSDTIRSAHSNLEAMLLAELRAAAAVHDVPWSEDAEHALRSFFRDELDLEVG